MSRMGGEKRKARGQPELKECVWPFGGGDGGGDARYGRSARRGYLNKGCADGGVRGKAEQKVERALLFRSCSSKGRGAPTVLRRRVVVCQCIRAAGFK